MPFPSDVESMNLYSFRQTLRDVSRPYLFMIEMPFIDTNISKLTAFARSTSLPKYAITPIEIPFQSQKLRLAGPATVDGTWNIEFLCDELHTLRNRFMSWLQIEYDIQKMAASAPVSYKYDQTKVTQLARNGARIATYQFVGLFPTSVGDIQLTHDETGWSKFPVEFAYDYFTLDASDPFVATNAAFQIGETGLSANADTSSTTGSTDINAQTGSVNTDGGA
jgi:hypothetical protein